MSASGVRVRPTSGYCIVRIIDAFQPFLNDPPNMADSQTNSGGLYVLDYGAGNVRSIANTLTKLGYTFKWISQPEDFAKADV